MRRWIDRATRRERVVDWVSGACLLVRRDAGDAAGWLDERYFMYAEDVDFCAALRKAGGQVLFTPVAEIVHLRGRSGRTSPGPTRERLARQPPGVLPQAPAALGRPAGVVSEAQPDPGGSHLKYHFPL